MLLLTEHDAIVNRQGATITTGSKLYKLGYSSSGVPDLNGNLSAAEVFYRNPDPNVTSTTPCYLNELWDDATNTFHTIVGHVGLGDIARQVIVGTDGLAVHVLDLVNHLAVGIYQHYSLLPQRAVG